MYPLMMNLTKLLALGKSIYLGETLTKAGWVHTNLFQVHYPNIILLNSEGSDKTRPTACFI